MNLTMVKQLPMFPDDKTIQVIIYKLDSGYQAEIFEGWWLASGKTQKEAMGKVIDRYQKETAYFGRRQGDGVVLQPDH